MIVCGDRPGPPDPPDAGQGMCCYGAAMDGPDRCTCWAPVYDLEQAGPIARAPVTRSKQCPDCAYRAGSPERAAGVDLPAGERPFWCHQGMRRIVAWRHPAGVEVAAGPGEYDPPIPADGVPLRADGTPADRCAGWAAVRR